MADCFNIHKRTTLSRAYNTAGLWWQRKGSEKSTLPLAQLLRLQAIHQIFHHYISCQNFVPHSISKGDPHTRCATSKGAVSKSPNTANASTTRSNSHHTCSRQTLANAITPANAAHCIFPMDIINKWSMPVIYK